MLKRVLAVGLAALSLAGAAQAQAPLGKLHDALRLSVAQEDAWRLYREAITPDPAERARAREAAAMMPSLPTPRRLALMRAQMQADLAAFNDQARDIETFYAALTPEQQQIFDRQTAAYADRGDD
jgi:hypothetical protein